MAALASCEKDPMDGSGNNGPETEPQTSHVIKVLTSDEDRRQEIDGFGCSFGWSESVYCHAQREAALEELYGDNGLRFNLYRGEVHPTYVSGEAGSAKWNFRLNDNYKVSAAQAIELLNGAENGKLDEFAQAWIVDYLTGKGYSKDIWYFFSVWSPNRIWKTNSSTTGGAFDMKHSEEFADFLSDFVKQYNEHFGIDIYGISGWNEPDQAMGGWEGCQWTEQDMTDFCLESLRPALDKKNLKNTQIVFDELPWWNNACSWMQRSYDYRPEIAKAGIVAAGHAYSSNIKDLRTMPEMKGTSGKPVHAWITETCDDKKNEGTKWSDGLAWAQNYQSYLMNANCSGIVWWAAMRPCTSTGENLLESFKWDYEGATVYEKMQRYYSIGQFSRYIPRGSYRYIVDSPNIKDGKAVNAVDPSDKNNRINGDVTFSSYLWKDKDGKENFTIVIVNPSAKYGFDTAVEIEGRKIDSMVSYTSTENVKWLDKEQIEFESGKRYVSVPKSGVVTVTGTCSDAR